MTVDARPRPDVGPVPPVSLTIDAAAGRLGGSNERYERVLADLDGLYADEAAFAAARRKDDGAPVYWVESSTSEPGPGGLITGLSVLEPGRIGDEFAMTRGHLHAIADRSEVYVGIAGVGVVLLETVEGDSRALPIGPGQVVYIPGHWIHRSVNVGSERLAVLFSYAEDARQDYGIIAAAGGMRQLVVSDGDSGWTTRQNPRHRGYRSPPAAEGGPT